MAHGDYYNPDNKVVVEGNVVHADDLNAINSSVDAALAQVASDLDSLEESEILDIARAWASEIQGIRPDPLVDAYSSKAYAIESKEYATNSQGVVVHKADGTTQVINSALVSATSAASSASSASTSASTATTQADIATTQAGIAGDERVLAEAAQDAAELAASTFTAEGMLSSIKTVDGPGSGLDADTLDGIQGLDLVPKTYPTFIGNEKIKGLFKQRLSTAGTYPTIVISGDSLSYNYQDYDATSRASAQACYPGMNSWAFMLRDAFIRDDPFFLHGDEVQYQIPELASATLNTEQPQFVSPFNGRIQKFKVVSQASTVDLFYRHFSGHNRIYLWFMKNPLDTGCSFQIKVNGVNQVSLWNTGGTTTSSPFQGRELHFIEVPNVSGNGLWNKITLTNFIGTATTPHATDRAVYLCGIGSKLTNIKLTGVGSQSSKYFADNVESLITTHSPDLVVFIAGSNDAWAGNPQGVQSVDDYETNVSTIIDAVTTEKSTAQFLLMSPPQTDGSVVPVETMQQYIDRSYLIATNKGVGHLDTAMFFEGTPPSVYRFDSIHFSKIGNDMLARRVAEMLNVTGNFTSSFSVSDYPYQYPKPQKERALAVYNGSAFVLTRISTTDPNFTPITSVEKLNDYTVKVNFSIDTGLYSNILMVQLATFDGIEILAYSKEYYRNYMYFHLRKSDGTNFLSGDWVTYLSSLKFIVECS